MSKLDSVIELLLESTSSGLMIIHQLNTSNLLFSKDNFESYLPAPSLAIIDPKKYDQPKFGDIALIVNPKDFDYNKAVIYDGDIYSSRVPSLSYKLNQTQLNKTLNVWRDGIPELREFKWHDKIKWDQMEDKGLDELYHSTELKYIYIKKVLKQNPKLPKVQMSAEEEGLQQLITRHGLSDVTENMEWFQLSKETKNKIIIDSNNLMRQRFQKDPNIDEDFLDEYYPITPEGIESNRNMERDMGDQITTLNKKKFGEFDYSDVRSIVAKKLNSPKKLEVYQDWVAETFSEHFTVLRFFDGFTNSGNRKYKSGDIDSVTKSMTGRQRNKEGFTYGVPNLRAKMAKSITTLGDAKKKKNRLVTTAEMEEYKKDNEEKFDNIVSDLEPHYAYDRFVQDAIIECLLGRDSFSSAFPNAPQEAVRAAIGFRNSLQNAPTEYFEIKYNKKVPLRYFSAALVPKNTKRSQKEYLKSLGMKILLYSDSAEFTRKLSNLKNHQF